MAKESHVLAPEHRAALFDKSRHMKQLDMFISHSWASGGWSKALSLLLQSGCKFALVWDWCWLQRCVMQIFYLFLSQLLPIKQSFQRFALLDLGP
eukprot:Skav209224  [mRNA]  locus=scaffold3787:120045:127557:+ [translate_table: standard]